MKLDLNLFDYILEQTSPVDRIERDFCKEIYIIFRGRTMLVPDPMSCDISIAKAQALLIITDSMDRDLAEYCKRFLILHGRS